MGFTARFLKRTDPEDPFPGRTLYSRAATELSALTIEEGHFTRDGEWVCEFVRRGDEIDCGAFVLSLIHICNCEGMEKLRKYGYSCNSSG